MLKYGKLFTLPFKRFMTTSSQSVLEPLENRTLIRVSGQEASNFLQGLMTNDIEHLSSGPGSLYTMFLNSAGRVLYDSIIYKTSNDNNTYLLECDKQISPNLQKHLKIYRVRKKIDISDLGNEMKIYALFTIGKNLSESEIKNDNDTPLPDKHSSKNLSKLQDDLVIFKDPRLASLGLRIITNSDAEVTQNLSNFNIIKSSEYDRNYRWLRYSLGIGEGTEELPPGECFPLESNCDYMHGVSFHKGCYIGQELTARVHHTGMIRKRLMPIYFTKVPSKLPDEKIIHENVNLGKLKGVEKDVGLALLRFNKALNFKEIKFGDGIGVIFKPKWWPIEAPKEKMNISKTVN